MCLIISLFILLATLIEVELLSMIAEVFGANNMWLLLVSTGFIGWRLVSEQKQQQQKIQMQMMRGELTDPTQMMRPLVTLLSGILLLVPRPLTDLIGLAMLHPLIGQRVLKSLFKGGLQAMMKNAQGGSFGAGGPFGGAGGPFGGAGGPFGGAGGPFEQQGPDEGASHDQDTWSIHQDASPSASRDGVHPTQKPRKTSRRRQGSAQDRGSVNPQQVIIDVDAEVVDK